jgi:hypothetical protein
MATIHPHGIKHHQSPQTLRTKDNFIASPPTPSPRDFTSRLPPLCSLAPPHLARPPRLPPVRRHPEVTSRKKSTPPRPQSAAAPWIRRPPPSPPPPPESLPPLCATVDVPLLSAIGVIPSSLSAPLPPMHLHPPPSAPSPGSHPVARPPIPQHLPKPAAVVTRPSSLLPATEPPPALLLLAPPPDPDRSM